MSREQTCPPLLGGFEVTLEKDAILPIRICARHLAALGAAVNYEGGGNDGNKQGPRGGSFLWLTSNGVQSSSIDGELECTVGWWPNNLASPGNEALIQATSGLMAVHGRDGVLPQRLGLEVASVAAGIVATQGVLAALIAKSQGYEVARVQTSVLEAALLFLYHHLSIATCSDNFPFRPTESGHGPPFPTADGQWVELEAMSGDSWKTFWTRLGVVEAKIVGAAWLPYVYRYLAGRCALPAALHETTRRFTFAELRRVADESGVALCRVRSYGEILAELRSSTPGQRDNSALNVPPPWSIEPGTGGFERGSCNDATPRGPLAGLRVVEVTSRLQGPLAGLLLHRLGAEVIKVEPPGGDFGKHSRPAAGNVGAAYLAYNRGKEVIEIDYKLAEGRVRLRDLAADADVFLHNWKSARAEDLGLDFEHLSGLNPELIYAHASGWGKMNQEPAPIAGDFLVQAHAACGDGLNPVGTPPFPSRLTLLDVTGGLLACEGILAGLCSRERYGCGSRVGTSLFSAAMSLQSEVLGEMATNQEANRRAGRPCWGLLDQPLETGEGFIMVAVEDAEARKRFLEICNIDGTAAEQATMEAVTKRLRCRTAAEWELQFRQAQIPCAVVRTNLAELAEDGKIAGLLERVDNVCWLPSAPWHFEPSLQFQKDSIAGDSIPEDDSVMRLVPE